MTIATLNTTIDKIRAEATAAFTAHKRVEENTYSDKNLSNDGKRARINESRINTAATLTALRAREDDAIKAEVRALESSIQVMTGVNSTDVISYRDAQDRADNLDNERAADRMMRRALASRDTTLATAVMRRAVDSGWTDVFEIYKAEHPTIASRVEDLNTITTWDNSMQADFERMIYTTANA